MELKLFFSNEEMIQSLKRLGYSIETVKSWESRSVYHNNVEFDDKDVVIAFKEPPLKEDLTKDAYTISCKYGIEQTFRRELRDKILNLF